MEGWKGVEHPTGIFSYTLSEKKNNPEITSILLYVDIDVKVFKDDDGVEYVWGHKSIKQLFFPKNHI